MSTARPADRPARETIPDGTALVILGGSGDLTSRLLLPGLGSLLAARGPAQVRLIGAARDDDWDDQRWQDLVRTTFTEAGLDKDAAERIAGEARWITTDATAGEDLAAVLEAAADGTETQVVYFALPPSVTEKSIAAIAALDSRPEGLRLALEKPFGSDEESARQLNALLTSFLPEDRIFRVDHFLGESMVLNMLTMRTANRLLERTWSAEDVEKVEIIWDEEIALEGRAGYYDGAGAAVDMLQSHLLQVMAYIAMETPAVVRHCEVHDAVAAVLRATHVREDDPERFSRRARYTAGTSLGRDIPDYADEDGVDASRKTETLTEVELQVDTQRWHGVPFILRSGKALRPARSQVILTFREPRFRPAGLEAQAGKDRLIITLAPEALRLELSVDGADTPFQAVRTALEAQLGEGDIDAYGDVLAGMLSGDPLLSVRGDMAEQSWRILQPVLDAWREDRVPLEEYPAGSRGPVDWASVAPASDAPGVRPMHDLDT